MKIDTDYLTTPAKIESDLSRFLEVLDDMPGASAATLAAGDILPLVIASLDLTALVSKLVETISALSQRMAISETTGSSQPPKPCDTESIEGASS
jgi:hypothetical protein